jgi:hypothetical protein
MFLLCSYDFPYFRMDFPSTKLQLGGICSHGVSLPRPRLLAGPLSRWQPAMKSSSDTWPRGGRDSLETRNLATDFFNSSDQRFSPPARWGSLDFKKETTPPPLLVLLLRPRPPPPHVAISPGPELRMDAKLNVEMICHGGDHNCFCGWCIGLVTC